MLILHVVGARPNFMKAAAVLRALNPKSGISQYLVHTGQHYDPNMSEVFFRQLQMPAPDRNLEVGSGSHAQQTAAVMCALEPLLLQHKPDLVLVYGDVNSTMAAALVCSKLGVRLGHVEAGLRSRDRTMPEEINRLVTDQLSDLLFTPSVDADENLRREGVDSAKIHRVGNVMIDTLVRLLPQAEQLHQPNLSRPYALVTLHRPNNVDDPVWLRQLFDTLSDLSEQLTIIFPVHPRTRLRLQNLGASFALGAGLKLMEPLPYLEFLALQRYAAMVITDSGGVQEETTLLGVPCLTVRENTERPVTLSLGTNQLVGRDLDRLREAAEGILRQKQVGAVSLTRVPLWDGRAATRIADIIERTTAD